GDRLRQRLPALRRRADHFSLRARRLLLAERALFAGPPRCTPVRSVPPHEVAAARHRPRGPWRRRVELCFTDGSRIVLALPWLEAPPPKRFLAALHRCPGPGRPHPRGARRPAPAPPPGPGSPPPPTAGGPAGVTGRPRAAKQGH